MIVYIINPIVINYAAMAILVLTDKFLNFNKLFFILPISSYILSI